MPDALPGAAERGLAFLRAERMNLRINEFHVAQANEAEALPQVCRLQVARSARVSSAARREDIDLLARQQPDRLVFS